MGMIRRKVSMFGVTVAVLAAAMTGCSGGPAPVASTTQATPVAQVAVPPINGMSLDDAAKALDEAGLKSTVAAGANDTIVTRYSPIGKASKGSTITLFAVAPSLEMSCYNADYTDHSDIPVLRKAVGSDFTQIWAARLPNCDTDETVTPTTETEKAVHKVASEQAGYTKNDISTLYGQCSRVRPDDVYLTMDGISTSQYGEIAAMLLLCPDHPLRDQYMAVMSAFDTGVTIDSRDERAWEALSSDVVAMFDQRTLNRSSDMLQVYCLPGLATESAQVLASGLTATEDQARTYLGHVCP